MIVDIFIPCFIDQFYPQTALNMVKILENLDCEIHYNLNQTCCGQPAYNSGYHKEAKAVANKFINEFNNKDRFIVSPSSSCVGMIRNHYENLFGKDELSQERFSLERYMLEFTEFLTDILEIDKIPQAKLEGLATYHDSCSALRECNIKDAPRRLLQNIEGLKLVEMANTEVCCGFGGTFAVKFQGISTAMAEQKIDNATATQAEFIISTDHSCLMQLEGYIQKHRKNIQTMHIIDALASGW